MRFIKIIVLLCFLVSSSKYGLIYGSSKKKVFEEIKEDSIKQETKNTVKKNNIVKKFLKYIEESNKEKTDRNFDFSIIAGPYYASDIKLGLGVVAAGLYKTLRNDINTPISNVSLYANGSTVGYYMLGVRGNHILPKDFCRINYNTYFYSFPSYFWGIGYDNAINKDNESKYKLFQAKARVEAMFKVSKKLYIGPTATYDFVYGKSIDKPELLNGQDKKTINTTLGVSLVYDTRNNLTNTDKGLYIKFDQEFSPSFMGNRYSFNKTSITASSYTHLHKNTILAYQINGVFSSGNIPWGLMPTIGGSYVMRGYYEGQYRDRKTINTQLELRQRIWKRHGATVWIGAGNIFSHFSELSIKKTLPNFGLGYRWEFKNKVNIRLDLGIGKGQTGFIFNINEAF